MIGKEGGLPWHLPEDLIHFKRMTLGCPVIMGRKTWDSLPPNFRPLPGRANVVVTRQPYWEDVGAIRADSLESGMSLCGDAETAWVIGGAQLYALAEPIASTIVVTEIAEPFDGDAFAPAMSTNWEETSRSKHVSPNGLCYDIVTYKKQRSDSGQ